MVELEARILERALDAREQGRVSKAEIRRHYDIPQNVLDRVEQLELLSPNSRGYDADEVNIIEAISRFRAGGYDEQIGFTVYDALRYREALQPLVEEEVRVLLERLAGEVEADRAAEIIGAGAEPLRELVGGIPSKLLLAELRRVRVRPTLSERLGPDQNVARQITLKRAHGGMGVTGGVGELPPDHPDSGGAGAGNAPVRDEDDGAAQHADRVGEDVVAR